MIPIDHLRMTTSLLIANVNCHQSRKTFTLLLAISFCSVTISLLQLVSELKFCTDSSASTDSQKKSENLKDIHYLFIFLSYWLVKPQPGRSSKIVLLALGRRFTFRCSKQFQWLTVRQIWATRETALNRNKYSTAVLQKQMSDGTLSGKPQPHGLLTQMNGDRLI